MWQVIYSIPQLFTVLLLAGCSDITKTDGFYRTVRIEKTQEAIPGAHYYECTLYGNNLSSKSRVGTRAEKLKFLIDSHLTIAFRNDHGPAHLVQLLVDVTGSLILVDHIQGVEMSVLIIEKNGQAVLSRHKLHKNINDSYKNTQLHGTCFEMLDVAFITSNIMLTQSTR